MSNNLGRCVSKLARRMHRVCTRTNKTSNCRTARAVVILYSCVLFCCTSMPAGRGVLVGPPSPNVRRPRPHSLKFHEHAHVADLPPRACVPSEPHSRLGIPRRHRALLASSLPRLATPSSVGTRGISRCAALPTLVSQGNPSPSSFPPSRATPRPPLDLCNHG
jgi:hypothetical protein